MPDTRSRLRPGQQCRVLGNTTGETELAMHGFDTGSMVTITESPCLCGATPSHLRASQPGVSFSYHILRRDLEPITAAAPAPTTCPCGGSIARCECECVACVEARATVAGQPHADCTRCGLNLPESSFGTRASGTRQSWCRDCSAAHARERRQAARASGTPTTTTRSTRRSTPTAFDRPFGLEIEVIHSDRGAVASALRAAGLDCEIEDYNHSTRPHWKIVPDGSLSRGFELVSPILRGASGRRDAKIAFQALRDAGAVVDRSCGLHVHHDATDMSADALARLISSWRAEQPLIDGLVAPSRRTGGGSSWCLPLDSNDEADGRRLAAAYTSQTVTRSRAAGHWGSGRDHTRYRTMNFRAYAIHGTIEVRQHQGTLNATKALNWVLFAQAMMARAMTASSVLPARTTIRDLLTDLEAVGLDAASASYLQDRYEAFAGHLIAA